MTAVDQPGPLTRELVRLAGTPDDSSAVDDRLDAIVRSAVTLPGVRYASVTAVRDGADTTVAISDELARAVDDAQYAEQSGPCLESLHTDRPIGVPDIAATTSWPRFREAAFAMGLRASLSIPLFAGSGTAIAVLNLYGHDAEAMTALIAVVRAAYESAPATAGGAAGPTAPGEADLAAGLTGAFAVRACIQQAVGVVMAVRHVAARDAYLHLRTRAAATGEGLPEVAAAILRSATRAADERR